VITLATIARVVSGILTQYRVGMIFLLLAMAGSGYSQAINTTPTDGSTPLGLSPGAPAGSYALSGFDNINPYNGNLNFRLPLLQIGGRGDAGYTIMLAIDAKKWQVRHSETTDIVTGEPIDTYYPSPSYWGGLTPGYGPGVMQGRAGGIDPTLTCPAPGGGLIKGFYQYTLTRLTFTAPDGTEYDFRDTLTGGQPAEITNPCASPSQGASRGTVFVTADGSAATFISDGIIYDDPNRFGGGSLIQPSGYMLLRDGTRYRIDGGRVSWIRDRNGNKISFTYNASGMTATDSLNRQVTVQYNYSDVAPFGLCDRIIFRGFDGAERIIRVSTTNLGSALRSGYSVGTYASLYPELNGSSSTIYDPPVVSAVWLPDEVRKYQLYYNNYAELARVVLPTGGAIEYDYTPTSGVIGSFDKQIYRRVVARRAYLDGGSAFESKMTFSSGVNPAIVNHYKPGSPETLIASEKHYYNGSPSSSLFQDAISYSAWNAGKEYQTESLAADGLTVLRRVVNNWQQGCAVSPWAPAIANNPRLADTTTTLVDTNQVSKQSFTYDCYNNQTDVYEYDFGAGAPGPLIRRTHNDYVTINNGADYAADTNIHIRNLPLQKQVFDAGGTKRAETFYEYDLYDNSPHHAPLIDRPGISGLDSGFTTGYTTRGNVTRTSRALLNNSGGVTGWINGHAQYDIAGNVVKAIDANSNPTTLEFSDRFGSPGDDAQQNTPPAELNGQTAYAFATKVTNTLGHTTYTKYDYYLGKTVASEDANGIVSSIAYNDALDRPTQGIQARYKVTTPSCDPPSVCVPAEKRQTTITYDDTNREITTTSDRDAFNDNILTSKSYYDSFGRTWRGAAYEGSTWTITDTQFDALGRVSQVSNPYRAADPGSASPPSGLWTTTEYDALGRVIKVTTPDGAHVDTAYSGNNTLVIDQAGKKRISRTDALVRLTNVWEVRSPDAASGTVSISFPNHPEITAGYQTDYLYDPLGNLRKVMQGAQTRWFAYDSLSRLIRVKNPEQNTNNSLPPHTDPVTGGSGWAMAYSYDANGNLVSKTDARNITTTYGYDALNRNTTVSYSDSTPSITHTYDTATLGKGRLQKAETAGSMGSRVTINDYDALGRPRSKSQQFFHLGAWGTSYTTQQTYDLAGNIKTLTYPSENTVDYSYDQAGRLSVFSGNLGGSPRTYADTISYNAAGQMIKERFGTNTSLYHNSHYNNRMQLVSTRVGDSPTDEWNWSRGAIGFYYGTTAVNTGDIFANDTDNNGNLRRQINFVPLVGGGYVIPQQDDYTYDALNRISSFSDWQRDSGGQWIPNVAWQNFSYDRYGNRKITGASGGVSNYNPTYDTTNNNNRILGLGYDAAGNIANNPPSGGTMTYDAENRMLTATTPSGGNYVYNADGKRVRRITSGGETWYVYGCGGELLAEYAANAQPTAPLKEYGYRGGQLLIVAESGSGGGVSFVKPTLKSSADLIGKAGLEADGNADGLSVVDGPVAALCINEGHDSITSDSSDSDNTRTLVRGGPQVTAEEYGNAPSANDLGVELLAEHPADADPNALQKEYRNRRGLPIVTVQGGGVVTLNPSANQSPDPGQGGTLAVTDISNIGHGSTPTGVNAVDIESNPPQNITQMKSARWSSFQGGPSGGIIGLKLKFDWTASGSVYASVEAGGSASARIDFDIYYSIDGGSSWTNALSRFRHVSQSGPGGKTGGISDGGSVEVVLSPSQNISLVQVRDFMRANAAASAPNASGYSADSGADITTSVSLIRLEVDTVPVITGVSSSAVTHNSAIISWNTNEPADSQLEYGTTTAYGQSTTLDPSLVTAHSQGLSGLTPSTQYHYRVMSRDATGNLAFSGDHTFTTAAAPDTTTPTVTSFSPAAGATNVNANANVSVTFSEAMDAASVNGSTVELRDPSNSLVSATVSYNTISFTATLNPTATLMAGTTYTARVRGGGTDPRVKDLAGNALAADVTWTFTTAQSGSGEIKWLVTDHLGSTRMVIDETGSLAGIRRHDFAPFGEELSAGVEIRSASNGYSGDSVRQKYDGYERDSETGLDFAGARYFASVQGRFTSIDPIYTKLERLIDPQRLNLYAFTRNNPLLFVDPDGMDLILDYKTEREARRAFALFQKGLTLADRKHTKFFVGDGKNGYVKGKFYALVDQKHQSNSENFKAVQNIANDRGEKAFLSVVRPNVPFDSQVGYAVLTSSPFVIAAPFKSVKGQDNYMNAHEGVRGQTLLPLRGDPLADVIYSVDNDTHVYVASDQPDVEIVVTMHHELRAHVYLSNVGRDTPKGLHGDPYVDGAGWNAQAEARANFYKNAPTARKKN
jgi:RHS repeat-associated protein